MLFLSVSLRYDFHLAESTRLKCSVTFNRLTTELCNYNYNAISGRFHPPKEIPQAHLRYLCIPTVIASGGLLCLSLSFSSIIWDGITP